MFLQELPLPRTSSNVSVATNKTNVSNKMMHPRKIKDIGHKLKGLAVMGQKVNSDSIIGRNKSLDVPKLHGL